MQSSNLKRKFTCCSEFLLVTALSDSITKIAGYERIETDYALFCGCMTLIIKRKAVTSEVNTEKCANSEDVKANVTNSTTNANDSTF